jgi:hypothetical protein
VRQCASLGLRDYTLAREGGHAGSRQAGGVQVALMSSSPPQSPAAAAPLDPARELEEADAELRKLGYRYNERDELRSVDAASEFTFVNQARSASAALACCGSATAALQVCARAQRYKAAGAGATPLLTCFALMRLRTSPQPHYEKLALGVAAYVQALLLARCGLNRRLVRGVDVYETPDAGTATGLLVRLGWHRPPRFCHASLLA